MIRIATFLLATCFLVAQGDVSQKGKLLDKLKDGYKPLVHPDDLDVGVGVGFICVDYNKRSHKLTSTVYERLHWFDARLQWDPKKYGGITAVQVPEEYIWKPDLHILNSVGKSEERGEVEVMIMSNGTVYWVRPSTYHTLCSSNYDHSKDDSSEEDHDSTHDDHPFSAKCSIHLESWTRDAKTMPIHAWSGGTGTRFYEKACRYVVKNLSSFIKTRQYPVWPNPFTGFIIQFNVEEASHEGAKDKHHDSHTKAKKCIWPNCP